MKKNLICLILSIFLFSNLAFSQENNYYKLGREAYSSGNYTLAQRYFWAIINDNPADLNSRYYLAHCLVKQKRYDQASVEYQRIIQTKPNSDVAKYAKESLQKIQPYLSPEAIHNNSQETKDLDRDYFVNALSAHSQVTRWKSMPISVYIPECEYKDVIKSAFQTWQNGSNGILSFVYTNNKAKSQIEIALKNKVENTSTEKTYIAGLTKPYYKGINLVKAEIVLLAINPNTKQPQPKSKIYATTLHEIGHAIGIKGHSQNPNDIMYASGAGSKNTLSLRDYNTLKMLYEVNPNALKNYANVIYNEKLKEVTAYVKKYPNKAIGWLNLADLYRSNKNYGKAIEMYKKALTIDKNQPDAYYFLGECYFNLKNYQTALKYYQYAVSKLPENKYYLHNFVRACVLTNNKTLATKYANNYIQKHPNQKNDDVIIEIINMLK